MNKYVVISVNENKDYTFFFPIVKWAWEKLGWNLVVLYTECNIDPIEDIRSSTLAQCSRLYAADLDYIKDEDYLMTSDIDMLPLSDYWKFNKDVITTWGHDLTGFDHYPICYIGMKAKKWKEIMNLTGDMHADMQRDFNLFPKSKSIDWTEWWQVDQDIITERLKDKDVYKVIRGLAPNSHYPLGRIDRGAWETTLQQPERIDAHLLRPGYTEENFNKILSLIKSIYPTEDLQWMINHKDNHDPN